MPASIPEAQRRTIVEVFRFGAVGSVGFLVDAGVLYLLVGLGIGPLAARCVSFPTALAATWLLNSRWTFGAYKSEASRARQAAGYVAVQLVGVAVNYAVYALSLNVTGRTSLGSVAALAIASAAGLVVNLTGSRMFVFKAAR
jgi:putative flippase GtrA